MTARYVLLFIASLSLATTSRAEQVVGMPVAPDPAPPAVRDSMPATYIDTTVDPRLDTLYVYVNGVVTARLAVNAYVRVYNAIDLPMKLVYHIGSHSLLVMSGRRSAPDLYDAGVWLRWKTVPRKSGTTFVVVARDGTRRDIQPTDP